MKNDTKIISREQKYQGDIFRLEEDTIELENGVKYRHLTLVHPGAIVVLAIESDGSILLVSQYRHSIQKNILEIPAGTINPGENPLECAKRELREETGMAARSWLSLGILHPVPGFCNEVQNLFLATDLYRDPLPQDDSEQIEVFRMSKADLDAAIKTGKITDGKTLAALYRATIENVFN